MKTCEYDGDARTLLRSHPWTCAVGNSAFRCLDLKATPDLIRTSLEDFVPWQHYPAVETFYSLLEWLHGPMSQLESNDCEFSGPHEHGNSQMPARLQCSGRVMVLYRDLMRNVTEPELPALTYALHRLLFTLDQDFELGMIGTSLIPVRYLSLQRATHEAIGRQLMLSFWAWGPTEADTMDQLNRLLTNLTSAMREVGASQVLYKLDG